MLSMTEDLDRLMTDNKELENLYYIDESDIHGKGLFSRVEIRVGDYMGTYDGPVVSDNGSHVLWVENDGGKWLGRDGMNLLRYINHKNEPYAEFCGFDLYALKQINVGDEVTIDYGEEPDPHWCE
jgi:hypothetical protein